jgi:hypothetical protein
VLQWHHWRISPGVKPAAAEMGVRRRDLRALAAALSGGPPMSRAPKQARTRHASIHSIVASKEFARGLDEVRNGLPFNPDNGSWDYERGRCFGFIAPLDMPLRIGRPLNPKALKLAEAAFARRLLI